MTSVPISYISERTGYPVDRLSKLALTGQFPSHSVGLRRRDVEQPIADAVVVLLRAGITFGPMIRLVLDDPALIATAAAEVAELLGRGAAA